VEGSAMAVETDNSDSFCDDHLESGQLQDEDVSCEHMTEQQAGEISMHCPCHEK
jgi:hypothetical protein